MERPDIAPGSDILTLFNASTLEELEAGKVKIAIYINRKTLPESPKIGGNLVGHILTGMVNFYTTQGVPWPNANVDVVTGALGTYRDRKNAVKGQDWDLFPGGTLPSHSSDDDELDPNEVYIERLARILAVRRDESWDSLDEASQNEFVQDSREMLDEVFFDEEE